MKNDRSKCYGCNKKMSPGSGYTYRDTTNLIDEDVTMCWRCLLIHVEKHFGDCPISKHLRAYYSERIDESLKRGQSELF